MQNKRTDYICNIMFQKLCHLFVSNIVKSENIFIYFIIFIRQNNLFEQFHLQLFRSNID